jgi:2-dehydro-3-deoxyphosphogluconate aldolase / (4S)-4-hydroxy-2-oxoglutarate aldolase
MTDRPIRTSGTMSPESPWDRVTAGLAASRVVPVATIPDSRHAAGVCEALARGGVGCIEITFRVAGAAEAIRAARTVDGMLVGAGTVLSCEQLEAAADAGAHFAVAPCLDPEVVLAARERGLPFFPGVATATEIDHARRLGVLVVKVFPASSAGGPAFLRAVSATYPSMRFMPTGGINPENLDAYLAVPSVLAAGGSWLVNDELVADGRYDEITRLAREVSASS